MVTVYEFPVKVKLPKQIEERLYGIAWDYVDALYNALDNFYDEEKSDQEMLEVAEMVRETLVDGINDAVEHIYK